MNRCYDEAENFHATFVGQTQAKDAYLIALQAVSLLEILLFLHLAFVQGDKENKLHYTVKKGMLFLNCILKPPFK